MDVEPSANGVDPVVEAVEQWSRERPDLDASPMLVFGRIARIFSLQRSAQAKVHDPYGLSHAAFDMLANLRRSGAPHRKTASALARSSMISTGGTSLRMDGLEESGLIRRVRDVEDRRVVHAELTNEGLAVIDEAIERHLELLDRLLLDLSVDERQQLVSLLARLERSIARNGPAKPQTMADSKDGSQEVPVSNDSAGDTSASDAGLRRRTSANRHTRRS